MMQPTLGLRVDCKSRANPLSTMTTAMGVPAKSRVGLEPPCPRPAVSQPADDGYAAKMLVRAD